MAKLAKYELLAKIATGGMAEIYVARPRDLSLGRACVVKKLLPQHAANEDFIQMFLDEGRIAAMFDHPNIVRMHDFGSEDGGYYLAMEYLHGEDLRTILRVLRGQGKRMPLAIAVAVIAAVCGGLHHAHETRGPTGEALEIVHRDVSPHNVFVTFDGAVKLVDFGIAKSTDRDWETKHGTLKGKVPYMAPEQVKGRRIDRRADLYAVGVLLYELVLGRRPYVLTTSGDFAMMMAITRHDVRVPSAVDPNIPHELERIILRALAYDPKDRYPSGLAMKSDLDKFAEERTFDTSPTALATMLASLFESRFEEWQTAQRAEKDLAAHAVEVEEARANSSVTDDDDPEDPTAIDEIDGNSTSHKAPSLLPAGSAASLVASTSGAVASVLEVFGVTVVSLQGRIDESFEGKTLGGSLSGTVLFDMAGVERITSFGVREWLEMMGALQDDVDAHLARCSEAVVTQLSLIQTFAGTAKVVSFDVPFLCDDCGNAFVRTLDCAHDGAIIAGRELPASTCPRCGGEAKLDDDPAYLAFAVPFAGRPVPDRVRGVLSRLDDRARGGGDAVDKVITAAETRVRVHRDVDPAFRWARVLDGLEGAVVVDFRGAPRFGREAAGRFARAIGALGSEVTTCEIVECPVEVAAALGTVTVHKHLRVGSMAFEGRCASCAAARSGAVPFRALEAAHSAGTALFVPCRRCNGPLELGDISGAMAALFARAPASSNEAIVVTVPASPAEASERAAPASHRVAAAVGARGKGRLRALPAVAGVVVIGALGLGGAALLRRGPPPPSGGATAALVPSGGPAAAPTSGTLPAPEARLATSSAGPASAVERRDDGVFVTVTARAPDEDRALVLARVDAIARILPLLERDLEPAVRAANAETAAAGGDSASAAERFVEQVGAYASPDRVDVKRRAEAGGVVLTATYHVTSGAWQRAAAHYSATRAAGGATFALAFPSRGSGLVVVAVDPGLARAMPVGSLVSHVDARPVTSLAALASLPRGRHTATLLGRGEHLEAKLNIK